MIGFQQINVGNGAILHGILKKGKKKRPEGRLSVLFKDMSYL